MMSYGDEMNALLRSARAIFSRSHTLNSIEIVWTALTWQLSSTSVVGNKSEKFKSKRLIVY